MTVHIKHYMSKALKNSFFLVLISRPTFYQDLTFHGFIIIMSVIWGTVGTFLLTAWDCLKVHPVGRKSLGPSPP